MSHDICLDILEQSAKDARIRIGVARRQGDEQEARQQERLAYVLEREVRLMRGYRYDY